MPIDELSLTVTPSTLVTAFSEDDGVFLGNGKIGVVTSLGNELDVSRVSITRNVQYRNGMYQPNILDVFNPLRWSFFRMNYDSVSVLNQSNSLVFENGVYQATYRCDDLIDNTQLDISSKIYVLRHAPYTLLQTLEIIPNLLGVSTISLFHEVHTNSLFTNVSYQHTFISPHGERIYQLFGSGVVDGLEVAFTSTYLFETEVTCLGAVNNIASLKPNSIVYKLDITNATIGTPIRVHVLTSIMTINDFIDPLSESRVSSTALSTCRPTTTEVITYHISKHVNAWSSLWNSKIKVMPKPDITQAESDEVIAMNKLLNTALYNIYASVRETYVSDVNNDNIPVIDFQGTFLYDSDVWLVPFLLIMKPTIARAIIDYRFSTILTAQKLAASYGHSGTKYPFINDVISNRNNMYYTSTVYTYIYNTAMIGINTWNYYRVSQDTEWLQEKGYKILHGIATYLCDIVKYDELLYMYYFEEVASLNGTVSAQDNALTNNLARLALRYALEASYTLRTQYPPKWNDVYDGLQLTKWPLSDELFYVSKYDSDATINDNYRVLDVLLSFTPAYWEEELGMVADINVLRRVIKSNLSYYEQHIEAETQNNQTNLTLLCILAGISMGTDANVEQEFKTYLQRFIDNVITGPWYFMKPESRQLPQSGDTMIRSFFQTPLSLKNSIYTNAMFLAIFLQGLSQVRITGGIGENRFPYADFKLQSSITNTLPSNWNMLTILNAGMNNSQKTIDVRPNNLQYSSSNNIQFPFISGSSGIPNFEIYTP